MEMMTAIKRLALAALLVAGFAATAPQADAGVFVRRWRPVRRGVARVVLPPYPVARRAAFGPVYRRPIYGPGFYGPGVVVGVGVY
jgi:hypothetical protein